MNTLVDTEVLVAGGGPTGLMLALGLVSRGIACRVIDRAPVRSEQSRAMVVHARSLELLQKLGIADELVACGRRTMAANVFINRRPALRVALTDAVLAADSPFPFILLVSQADTERVLEERLARLGTRVERPVELLGFAEEADGVQARLRHADGREEAVRARYVVGCDGAHSAVRKGAGLSFEGAPYPQDFVLADLRVDWERNDGGLYIFVSSEGLLAAFPFQEPGSYRLIASRSGVVPAGAGDPTLDEFRAIASRISPFPMQLSEPRWLARFRLHHRVANHYRAGRAFVAGDAAHIHSPAGGQGMNTGIQDAANLAWKLALVLRGLAPDAFLDSYEAERLPVGRRLLRTTDRMFATASARHPVALALGGFLLPRLGVFALGKPAVRERVFRFLSQLEIAYPASPAVEESRPRGTRFRGGPGAGHRAPDAPVARGGSASSLFAICTGAAHHLLVFPGSTGGDAIDAIRTLATEHLPEVEIHRIDRTTPPAAATAGAADAWVDESGEGYRRYAVTDAGYYLIRPDGYIAFRAAGLTPEPLAAYLHRVFNARRGLAAHPKA
jgi:2-polyprenyl-6-methoxyphenol hydroxylase-like FAD-dependent oxidoreductase